MRGVALLRGINVGGSARVPMAELRELFDSLGLTDVATYVQSGNVVFTAASLDAAKLAGALEKEIAAAFKVRSSVLVRTGRELAAIGSRHPFEADEPTPAKLHVVFLRGAPSKERAAALDPDRSPGDRFALRGRELYVHYPNGQGRSKLTVDYIEKALGTVGTARNWNTVQKLRAMVTEVDR